MKVLRPDHPPDHDTSLRSWFAEVGSSDDRLLLLDFDGTLAPFTVERLATRPYPGIQERPSRIMVLPDSRLIVISGRFISSLRRLLPLEPHPEFWGGHDWEQLPVGADTPTLHR